MAIHTSNRTILKTPSGPPSIAMVTFLIIDFTQIRYILLSNLFQCPPLMQQAQSHMHPIIYGYLSQLRQTHRCRPRPEYKERTMKVHVNTRSSHSETRGFNQTKGSSLSASAITSSHPTVSNRLYVSTRYSFRRRCLGGRESSQV